MRTILCFLFCGILFFPLQSVHSSGNVFKKKEDLQKFLSPYAKALNFSWRDAEGREVLAVNGDQKSAPASVAKLLSSACSLEILSPVFQFETTFGYRGKIENGMLLGDLIVRGSGDPSFVVEDLRDIVDKLRKLYGIQEVKGGLILDLSYLGVKGIPISEDFGGDAGRSFTAELTSLPFDHNSFAIWVIAGSPRPNAVVSPTAAVSAKIMNAIKSGPASSPSLHYDPNKQIISLGGTFSPQAEPRAFYRSVPDPLESFARVLFQLWTESGGRWPQRVLKFETNLVSMTHLWTHKSKPLARLLADINKLSTNFGSELVMLAAAKTKGAKTPGLNASKKTLDSCFEAWGVKKDAVMMENASGLSRHSAIEVSELTRLLRNFRSQYYYPEYLSSLSILGMDGTTRSRMKNARGRARVKTGSLRGIHTIAGYVFDREGNAETFALFHQCPSCSRDQFQQIEDKVLQVLLQ